MLSQLILIAFRNVALAKRRTVLLGISLSVVSCLFIILSALTQGVTEKMIDSATTLSAGHVNVGGFFKFRANGVAALVNERSRVENLILSTIPDARVIDRQRGWGRLIGPESSINTEVNGINVEMEKIFFETLSLAQEKDYEKDGGDKIVGDFADLKKKDSALIFAGQAKKLGASVGDIITLVSEATGGQTNSVDLTVVAIAKDLGMMSNWHLFVPRQTLQKFYDIKEDTTGAFMIYLNDINKAEGKMAELRTVFENEGFSVMEHDPNPFFLKFDKVMGEDWLGQKIDFTLWKDEISFILWISMAMKFITFLIISILSFIVASGIANAMWMSVRERIKEIGTMRAIGADRKHIRRVFLLESLILGLIFVSGGAIVSTLLIVLLNALKIPLANEGVKVFLMTDTLFFSLAPSQIIATIGLFCLVAMAGAFFPAMRAARLRPADALRHGKQ
ncbi:MAG: ABC transporter permease [Deltaproteobacteria bacterium]|nr:ABC transporter permease [Deltaproteobacteria bacterium]